jgi:hypothetical protein
VYGAHGNELNSEYQTRDGSVHIKMHYEYDENGRRNGERMNMSQGLIISFDTLVYYGKGELKEKISFSENGEIISRTLYLYDRNSNNIETIIYASDAKVLSRTIASFNGDKQKVMSVFIDDDKLIIWRYEYNELNEVVWTVSRDALADIETNMYTEYDSNRNEISRDIYDGSTGIKSESTTEYTYDSKQNWVRSVTKFSGNTEGVSVVVRDIKYLD